MYSSSLKLLGSPPASDATENPTYKGSVLLYPKPFLDKFFGGVSEGNGNTKQMLHG